MESQIINIVETLDLGNSDFSLLPWIIILISLGIIFIYLVKIEVSSNGTNWEINKCSSKYVFFSGFMNKKGNDNPLNQTFINFNDCIKRFL
jgi:hypothetical protein